ncbi:MAG: ABC transporter ATP-binding protein [Betaproteobacteria bacterium]|nr:ABC transporter ATP-binding protein [Betaproteobacteria bacterium]
MNGSTSGLPLLSVEELVVTYPPAGRWRKPPVRAVDRVSFEIGHGEILGLVGESGCGKSTTALAVLRLVEALSGRIVFDGEEITRTSSRRMRHVRRRLQAVFQDPFGSLDPRMTVRDIVAEPLDVHGMAGGRVQRAERVTELLAKVGLAEHMADRYPHEFSGGQRQRIGIARAIALGPSLVVCDEPVSALDVSVQAQIVNLLLDIRQKMGVAYLFISHDLAIVRHLSDRVAVMLGGRIIEIGPAEELFAHPLHPYTKSLVALAFVTNRGADARVLQESTSDVVADTLANSPSACVYCARCPKATEVCRASAPALTVVGPGRRVACHAVA